MCIGGKNINNMAPAIGLFGAAASGNPNAVLPATGLFPSMVANKQSEKVNKAVSKYSPIGLGMAAANNSEMFKVQ